TEQCETCGRALPRAEQKAGQPLRFCYERHTQWRVPDHKGRVKLMKCRDVAAAWQVEEATRSRTGAPGPPIDLHGLGELVTQVGTMAAELRAPAQALAERTEQIQGALAGDVAAARRAVEAMTARVREMEGKVAVAEGQAAEAKAEAERARARATAAVADAERAARTANDALAARDRALGERDAERGRRTDAEAKRDAALTAKDLAEGENARLATTVAQHKTRIDALEQAATRRDREHREEIGRLHQEQTAALAAKQAEHDRALTERTEQERARFDQELQRITTEHAAERDRLTAEHAAERDRLIAELATVREAAAAAAREHFEALGHLNRELGGVTAQAAAADTARQAATTDLASVRARLADLVAAPPENLTDQLAQLLSSQEGGTP
ncbi:MAG TPA: hypothetical protein VFG15_07080, partial [Amycolatopsis sp.]|nr:hypothetical protein [Amycolatopsis sp.]